MITCEMLWWPIESDLSEEQQHSNSSTNNLPLLGQFTLDNIAATICSAVASCYGEVLHPTDGSMVKTKVNMLSLRCLTPEQDV